MQQLLIGLVADAAADGQGIRLENIHHVGDARRQIAHIHVADLLAHRVPSRAAIKADWPDT